MEDNDTVTTVPLKRPTGTDLELKNLTTAPIEDGAGGKLIFASCKKEMRSLTVKIDVMYRVLPQMIMSLFLSQELTGTGVIS